MGSPYFDYVNFPLAPWHIFNVTDFTIDIQVNTPYILTTYLGLFDPFLKVMTKSPQKTDLTSD